MNPTEAEVLVDGWWGHYQTSQALLIAIALGWPGADEEDLACVHALALTYLLKGGYVEEDHARQHRREARLPDVSGGALLGLADFDLLETLSSALDDAENWLTENLAPDGFYYGSHPDSSDWGMWPQEEDLL
jgi:hypothetical protein